MSIAAMSGTWSAAPARATIEYDRALLYLLAFVACGSFGYTTYVHPASNASAPAPAT
jgi:hypothetical protein